jgi:hypothetical protein
MACLPGIVALAVAIGAPPALRAQAPRAAAVNQSPSAAAPTARIGTMSELMIHMIYPTSDAIFYITSRTPKTDAEWTELQAKTLTLAESANLLMMPGRARDQGQWMKDARLMLDAGWAAFKAAKAKDAAALEALSDQLYESCVTCHKNYRPDYDKPKPPPGSPDH